MHPTRIFRKPEELYKAFEEYKASLKEKAKEWGIVNYVGKDGNRVEDYPNMPLTFSGFKVFCYDIYGSIEQYFVNQDNNYSDFLSICSRIKEEIRDNQITGGMLGKYNASITQRLNALKEHSEVTTEEKPKPMFGENPLENK